MAGSVDVILDCFLFCHELDLLEVRLKVLYDYVDKFVILESPNTHSGKPKAMNFQKNRERFKWADSKIVHLIDERSLPEVENDFTIEKFQREYLLKEARKICSTDDLIMISDVDEFPSREVIEDLRAGKYTEFPIVMKQDLYYYNVKCPRKKKWLGTVVLKPGKETLNQTVRDNRYKLPGPETGWHFSYFMTPEDIAVKLKSFAHCNMEDLYSDPEYIMGHVRKNTNFLRKADGDQFPREIPGYILDEMKNYPVFMGVYE